MMVRIASGSRGALGWIAFGRVRDWAFSSSSFFARASLALEADSLSFGCEDFGEG